MTNADRAYLRTRALLHWTIAALVMFQIFRHHEIGRAYHAVHDKVVPAADDTFWANLHVCAGILVLLLAAWLLWLRYQNGPSAAPANEPPFLRLIASATHWALFALIVLSPLTGLLAWYLDVRISGRIHSLAELPALALIGLHSVGAAHQHFVLKSDIFRRILPWR